MNQQQWDEMSDKQKHSYLYQGQIEIKSVLGADGNSKVGEVVVNRYYYAICRGIQVSGYHEKNSGAALEAEAFINSLVA